MKSVSPTKAASPITCVMQAGVWPGVKMAKASMLPIRVGVAILEQRSNWLPSRWNSVPSLNTLPKVSCTTMICGADADLAAELLLDIGRGGEVIGMHVGLDDPFQRQAALPISAISASAWSKVMRPAA